MVVKGGHDHPPRTWPDRSCPVAFLQVFSLYFCSFFGPVLCDHLSLRDQAPWPPSQGPGRTSHARLPFYKCFHYTFAHFLDPKNEQKYSENTCRKAGPVMPGCETSFFLTENRNFRQNRGISRVRRSSRQRICTQKTTFENQFMTSWSTEYRQLSQEITAE